MNTTECLVCWSMWITWLVYWVASARGAKPAAQRESDLSRRLQSLPLIVGGMLLGLPALGLPAFDARYRPDALPAVTALGLALIAAGLLFTVWARVFLGSNWSVSVTLKQGHELVRGGPYGWVRHPIYSGALLALTGTAVLGGQWRGLVGLALVSASLVYKIGVEERLLGKHFGDDYWIYRQEVAALVPGIY